MDRQGFADHGERVTLPAPEDYHKGKSKAMKAWATLVRANLVDYIVAQSKRAQRIGRCNETR